jgi:hypothetical protein
MPTGASNSKPRAATSQCSISSVFCWELKRETRAEFLYEHDLSPRRAKRARPRTTIVTTKERWQHHQRLPGDLAVPVQAGKEVGSERGTMMTTSGLDGSNSSYLLDTTAPRISKASVKEMGLWSMV